MSKSFHLPVVLFFIVILSVWHPTNAQPPIVPSRATKSVDGSIADWSLPLRFYDKDSHLQYSLANNDSMLYICFRVTEPEYQMKILKGGLTINIDTTGKKREDISLICPIPENRCPLNNRRIDMDGSMPQSNANQMQYLLKEELPLAFSQYTLEGFKHNGTFSASKDTQNIKVATMINDFNAFVIEYSIRISSFYKPLQPSDAERKISLSFVVKGISAPSRNIEPHMSMAGGNHGGDGEMGGGQPPKGGPKGGSSNQSMLQTTRTKVKMVFNMGE